MGRRENREQMPHRRPRRLAAYLAGGALVFALVVAIAVAIAAGRMGGLLARGGPTPDPRWRAIATEQALGFNAPLPVVTRTPRAANGAGTPPSKPSATVGATRSMPAMTPSSIAPTPSPSDLIARLARAEADLRSGEFTNAVDYADGQRASSTVRFALDSDPGQSRLHVISIYRGITGERRLERVIIGDQAWERVGEGAWQPVRVGESVKEQVGALLPRSGDAGAVTGMMSGTGEVALRWQDRASGAAIEVSTDPRTGIPKRLVRANGAGGAVQAVAYQRWNVPIEILQPVNP
jgi:hypothetical protein